MEISDPNLASGSIKVGDVWGDQENIKDCSTTLTVCAIFNGKVWVRYRVLGSVHDSVLPYASIAFVRLIRRDGVEYTGKDCVSKESKGESLSAEQIVARHERDCASRPEFFKCPDCNRKSYSRGDIDNGYCGACCKFFSINH